MTETKPNVVDANVIVRFLVRDDEPLYERSNRFMSDVKAARQEAILLESVLAEIVFVLARIYKVPRESIAVQLTGLLGYAGVVGENLQRLRAALELYGRTNLSIVDALCAITARDRGVHLMTFDAKLAKVASQVLRSQ